MSTTPHPKTVLLIDDDTDVRESLAEIISEQGFDVVTARNGEEGIRVALERRPSLIFLDLMMPVMSGWDVRPAMKRIPELADIPVVVLSGVDDVHQQVTYLDVDGYLRKPVEVKILLEVVKSYCS
jgi:DNA-binding response OmpR family regulator